MSSSKCDRSDANRTIADLKSMLKDQQVRPGDWRPPVIAPSHPSTAEGSTSWSPRSIAIALPPTGPRARRGAKRIAGFSVWAKLRKRSQSSNSRKCSNAICPRRRAGSSGARMIHTRPRAASFASSSEENRICQRPSTAFPLLRSSARSLTGRPNEVAEFVRRAPERKEQFFTLGDIPVKRTYTAADIAGTPVEDIGLPGRYPFTRGPYPTMYRGRNWTMRQIAGFGTGEDTNQSLQIPDQPGPDRDLDRFRYADADGLRQ